MSADHLRLKSCGIYFDANVHRYEILYKMEDIIKRYKQGYKDKGPLSVRIYGLER